MSVMAKDSEASCEDRITKLTKIGMPKERKRFEREQNPVERYHRGYTY